ncbi:MAG: tetratricopeptide repeat protein, partial [Persicimonas sp.]
VVSSQQAGAMAEAARIHEERGEDGKARELFEATVQRYPTTSWPRAELARFWWERDEYDTAAGVLADGQAQHDYDWNEYSEAFGEVFEKRDTEEAVAAFEALQKRDVPALKLRSIVGTMAHDEIFDMAFELSRRLEISNRMNASESVLRSYGYLREAEGADRAQRWLEEAAKGIPHGVFAMVAFQEGEYELLWEYLDELPEGDTGEATWLFRATGVLLTDDDDERRRKKLDEHFADEGSNWYYQLGRYMWTGEGEEDLIDGAGTTKKRCEAAFWLGLKAQLEGDYAAASDWYHVSILTEASNNGEYHWSVDELYRWVSGDEAYTLRRLERERPFATFATNSEDARQHSER